MATKTNAIVIHGGGLVDPSKHVLMRIGSNLSYIYDNVYIGKYSFESLYTPEFITHYDNNLIQEVKGKRGSYFGTSRGIDLCNSNLFEKTLKCLIERNIKTIVVAGGDGSSRQIAELSENLMKHGINIIFPVPLTIDGINGGLSIGINEVIKESIRQIENIASASLQTRDFGKYSVVMVELQGRNRDDIMANVLEYFYLKKSVADHNMDDITLIVVPANIETDPKKLIDEINASSKKTLILLSEGAKDQNPTLSIPELKKMVERKVRSLTIGHPSQCNNMTTQSNIATYNHWVDCACSFIDKDPCGTFSIVYDGISFFKESIDYYAKLNPRKAQKAQLSPDLNSLIQSYMVK